MSVQCMAREANLGLNFGFSILWLCDVGQGTQPLLSPEFGLVFGLFLLKIYVIKPLIKKKGKIKNRLWKLLPPKPSNPRIP